MFLYSVFVLQIWMLKLILEKDMQLFLIVREMCRSVEFVFALYKEHIQWDRESSR